MHSILIRTKHDPYLTEQSHFTKAAHLEILVVDSEPLPKIPEDHWAVFLEFEMARHVFPATVTLRNEAQTDRRLAGFTRPCLDLCVAVRGESSLPTASTDGFYRTGCKPTKSD